MAVVGAAVGEVDENVVSTVAVEIEVAGECGDIAKEVIFLLGRRDPYTFLGSSPGRGQLDGPRHPRA